MNHVPMNRPGFRREWPKNHVAHKGYWDRHGRHVVIPIKTEDRLAEACGGCLVSLYRMPLRRIAELMKEGEAS